MNTSRYSAFISHSGPDDRYVAEFVQLVRSLGFTEVFNDSHTIEPDEKFWDRIEQGIRDCDAFVVILSQASVKSYWVDKEVQFARNKGKRVIPIRIDDCKLPNSFDGRDVIELKHAGKGQRLSPPRFIHHAAEHFLGREPQLALLDEAWTNGTNVLSIIAWGGVGKTALIAEWVQTRFIEKQWKTEDGQTALAAYFDWTFYDQGTRSLADGTEARTGSVGDFFEQALVFFGDPDPNLPGKGRRLADLIRQQRSLIILDGLEPLQQPPGHPQAGRLLDPDLRDLLAALAQSNPGLCLNTSRQALTDLHSLRRTVHTEHELEDLPVAIAISLLRQLQIKGTDQELAEACEKFGGHALSLTLLGRFLCDAHDGDIRRLDRIDLQRADDLTRDSRQRSVWRILETYEHWLATAKADGNPKTLAVLRLTGLFDRTATADCLAALRAEPTIPGLTDAICAIADDEWNILLKRLQRAHLIKLRKCSNLSSRSSESPWAIDAHPLIREYFGKQLRQTQLESLKSAHSRLFDHLCSTAPESTKVNPINTFLSMLGHSQPPPATLPTLTDLQPLYQAVAHGCLAGRAFEARQIVFYGRILRGTGTSGFYSRRQLGAHEADLAALTLLSDSSISNISDPLRPTDQTWLLSECANSLRALGRLDEALNAMSAAMKGYEQLNDSTNAAITGGNLCELNTNLGHLTEAIEAGYRAIEIAEESDNQPRVMIACTITAAALQQAGRSEEATWLFSNAHTINQGINGESRILSSTLGYRLADLQLAITERAAWRAVLCVESVNIKHCPKPTSTVESTEKDEQVHQMACHAVKTRTKEAQRLWRHVFTNKYSLLDVGNDELSIARVELYLSVIRLRNSLNPEDNVETLVGNALAHLRNSNDFGFLPPALQTAAFYHGTLGENLEEAERLLEEAQQIAERGPMPLYLADVHLHRARLFGRMNADERNLKFPEIDPKAELREARRLIEKHGYWRRKEELEDAEAAAVNW